MPCLCIFLKLMDLTASFYPGEKSQDTFNIFISVNPKIKGWKKIHLQVFQILDFTHKSMRSKKCGCSLNSDDTRLFVDEKNWAIKLSEPEFVLHIVCKSHSVNSFVLQIQQKLNFHSIFNKPCNKSTMGLLMPACSQLRQMCPIQRKGFKACQIQSNAAESFD